MKALKTIGYLLAGIAFFWLFGLKLIIKYMKAGSAPCPASLSWIVDLPIRRRYMRPVLDRVGMRPGETVLELGPGPGAFTLDAARRLGANGTLITVDIQPEMIAQVKERVRQAGLSNVETSRRERLRATHRRRQRRPRLSRHCIAGDTRPSSGFERGLSGAQARRRLFDHRRVSGSGLPAPQDDYRLGASRRLRAGRKPRKLVRLHAQFPQAGLTRHAGA